MLQKVEEMKVRHSVYSLRHGDIAVDDFRQTSISPCERCGPYVNR